MAKNKRIKSKPGLIPPFYADLPKTLDQIIDSELKYLNQYEVNEYVVEATKLINKKEILQINQSVLGMTMLSASFKASENKNIRNEVYAPVINKKLEQNYV